MINDYEHIQNRQKLQRFSKITYNRYYIFIHLNEMFAIVQQMMLHDLMHQWDWPYRLAYAIKKMIKLISNNAVTKNSSKINQLTICCMWCGWLPSSTLSCESCCEGGPSEIMLSLIILAWLTLCDKFVGIGTPNGSICMLKLDWASILPCSSDVRSVDVEPEPD